MSEHLIGKLQLAKAVESAQAGIVEAMVANNDASSFIRVLVALKGDDYVKGYCDGIRAGLDAQP